MKNLIRLCINNLGRKRITEEKIPFEELKVSKSQIICFNLSSNAIWGIEKEDGLWFFRQCQPIVDAKTFWEQKIQDFFDYIHNNQIEKLNFAQELPIRIAFAEEDVCAFRAYLPKDKKFLKAMLQMDRTLRAHNYSIWSRSGSLSAEELAQFGLLHLPESLADIATYFLWYMRGVADAYRNAALVRGEHLSFTNAVKSVSTQVVAAALELDDLVTTEKWCKLNVDGMIRYGILCRCAEGIRGRDTEVVPTGALQKALMNLNVLDTLCFQQDHGPNNYNVVFKDGLPSGVCAFDNDNPNTFSPLGTATKVLSGCTPIVGKNGIINRPFFDEELAAKLRNLDRKSLAKSLKLYLNGLQRMALLRRIQKLCCAIRKTAKYNPHFLVSPEGWGEDTMAAELQENVGHTYLKHLIQK